MRHGIGLALVLALAATAPATAGGFERSTTIEGSGGRTISGSGSVTRGDGGFSREATVQGSEGRGFSVSGSGQRNRETNSYAGTRTVTTNGGQVIVREATRDCDPSGGTVTCAGQVTRTGPNGTSTAETTRSYSDGAGQTTVTRTGPFGRVIARERWIRVNP